MTITITVAVAVVPTPIYVFKSSAIHRRVCGEMGSPDLCIYHGAPGIAQEMIRDPS